jgi:hypothetical protein
MIGTRRYQEGFKALYRGLALKPPPLAVVVDFFFLESISKRKR